MTTIAFNTQLSVATITGQCKRKHPTKLANESYETCQRRNTVLSLKTAPGAFEIEKITLVLNPLKAPPLTVF